MIGEALYMSRSEEWGTPQKLFDKLDAEFHFGLDVCATPQNAKCKNFFTKADDGLSKKWGGVRLCLVQSSIRQKNLRVGAESV